MIEGGIHIYGVFKEVPFNGEALGIDRKQYFQILFALPKIDGLKNKAKREKFVFDLCKSLVDENKRKSNLFK